MESKMRFGREVRSEKPQAPDRGTAPETPKKNAEPNRRSFLQGMAGLLAGTALESESFAKKSKKNKEKELTPEEWDALLDSPWQTCVREVRDVTMGLHVATREILDPLLNKYAGGDRAKEIVADRERRSKEDPLPGMPPIKLYSIDLPDILSPEDRALVHKKFQDAYGDRVKLLFENLKRILKKISEQQDVWKWVDTKLEIVEYKSQRDVQSYSVREQKLWKKITTQKHGEIYVLPEHNRAKTAYFSTARSFVDLMGELRSSLQEFGSDGYIYSFLSDVSRDIHSTMRDKDGQLRFQPKSYEDDFDEYNDFFTLYACDYLPRSNEILPEHIDPFIAFVQKKYNDADQNISRSKWVAGAYQSKFKKMLDEPAVRQQLQAQPNLSLAGAFSLIKAVIEYKENISPNTSESKILDKLLVERNKFAGQKLIDAQTTVVHFYGFDNKDRKTGKTGKNRFTPSNMNEILSAAGVPKEKNLLFETEQDPNAFMGFLKTIGESRDKTFVSVDTHGSEYTLSIKNSDFFGIDLVGFELAHRVVGVVLERGVEAARRTLGNVTFYSHACHPYVFLYENLLPEMKKSLQSEKKACADLLKLSSQPDFKERFKRMYGIEMTAQALKNLSELTNLDPESLDVPRVLGNGQKGNTVYDPFDLEQSSSYVLSALLRRKQGIIDRQAVIGEDFFTAEPYVYPRGGDMTFSSYEKGRLFPISEVTTPRKSSAPEKKHDLA
jgi:hypothetical protein